MATDDKYDRQLRLWGAHGQVRTCLSDAELECRILFEEEARFTTDLLLDAPPAAA